MKDSRLRENALRVLEAYGLDEDPRALRDVIERGKRAEASEALTQAIRDLLVAQERIRELESYLTDFANNTHVREGMSLFQELEQLRFTCRVIHDMSNSLLNDDALDGSPKADRGSK